MGKVRRGGPVRDVAVDLGTSAVRIAVRGRGILLREPAAAALDRPTGKFLCGGEKARQLLGRSPDQVLAVRPMEEGVVRDAPLAEAMLRNFLQQALPGRLLKPRLLFSVPAGAALVDEGTLVDVGLRAGARKVYLMEGPLAAAMGAGARTEEARGHLVVDIGGGAAEAAVIALGGVAASARLRTAGDAFDLALLRYVRERHGLLIGKKTAEEVKKAAGQVSAAEEDERPPFLLQGKCLETGLPRQLVLTPAETAAALDPVAEELIRGIKEFLERTPPALAADAAEEGILLVGGGALLRGLDKMLAEGTGLPVTVAEDPEEAVIRGMEMSLATLSRRKDGVLGLARRRAVAEE